MSFTHVRDKSVKYLIVQFAVDHKLTNEMSIAVFLDNISETHGKIIYNSWHEFSFSKYGRLLPKYYFDTINLFDYF